MKRRSRLDFKGVSSLPADKSRELLGALDAIVQHLLASYQEAEDPKMPRQDRGKKIAELGSLSDSFRKLELHTAANLQVIPSAFDDILEEGKREFGIIAGNIRKAEDCQRKIQQRVTNDDILNMFEAELEIVKATIQLLKVVDRSTIEKITRFAEGCSASIKAADECHSVDDLVELLKKTNFGSLAQNFALQLQYRAAAYKGEQSERMKQASEFLRVNLPAAMNAKKAVIDSPSDREARERFQSLARTIEVSRQLFSYS